MLINKYPYRSLNRLTQENGKRHYICPETNRHLPSVTTIIDQTSDKTGLLEWRKRVGEKEAERIKNEATGLGTLMHTHLECHIAGMPRPTGTNLVRQVAEAMADQIIEHGFPDLQEVWGSEAMLYEPGLYAGTADLTCVYNGRPAIGDFKTARKMKKREHIEGYFMQIAAYGLCHDSLYGTEIDQGVIFMVDRDFNYECFVIEGAEFRSYQSKWLDKVEIYYSSLA